MRRLMARRRGACASARVLLVATLGLACAAVGQEVVPTVPEQASAPVAPQSTPETTGATPPQSDQQRKQQRKQRKQQRELAGTAPAAPSMKEVFAGTVAAVVQASGGALLSGVAQVITGGLLNWFSRKVGADDVPDEQSPAALAGRAPADIAAPAPDHAAAISGAPGPEDAIRPEPALQALDGIAAGLAFEVHRLLPDGATSRVDPAAHEFRTGERFVVYFRPSLPGRIDIYNINPASQQLLIDTQELAAGQLTRLGPYEFTATTGDEQLRLVMQPCSTPQLTSATRDIVRVRDTLPVQSGIELQSCSATATRSAPAMRTRDIRKLSEEDGTQFALDPLGADEIASGQIAPREVTLRFRHR